MRVRPAQHYCKNCHKPLLHDAIALNFFSSRIAGFIDIKLESVQINGMSSAAFDRQSYNAAAKHCWVLRISSYCRIWDKSPCNNEFSKKKRSPCNNDFAKKDLLATMILPKKISLQQCIAMIHPKIDLLASMNSYTTQLQRHCVRKGVPDCGSKRAAGQQSPNRSSINLIASSIKMSHIRGDHCGRD